MNFQALYLMDLSFYPFLSLFRSFACSLCLFRYSPDAFAIANGPLVRFLCLCCFFYCLTFGAYTVYFMRAYILWD